MQFKESKKAKKLKIFSNLHEQQCFSDGLKVAKNAFYTDKYRDSQSLYSNKTRFISTIIASIDMF